MAVAQPAFQIPQAPFGAVLARQVSVWPFAARTARLFLLVDPSSPDRAVCRGVVRAMQHAYFRSDGCSQTRAVREAALAAHYVLRHHNRDALLVDQVSASSAVAGLRGNVAFVALVGDAAAFAWRDGALTGQRGILHLPRPLGLEHEPRITLWSTTLDRGDQLVLVCGAKWRPESPRLIERILSETKSTEPAEAQLAEALGGSRNAGVLVVKPSGEAAPKRHLGLVLPGERVESATRPRAVPVGRGSPARPALPPHRWLWPLVGVVLLAAAAMAAFNPPVSTELPTYEAKRLEGLDRAYSVTPAMAVWLGPAGHNVVDLAVGDDALYTLDVVEASVRAFGLDARDQQPSPETLLARTGSPIDAAGHRLATPVAIEYVSGARPEQGVLAIVDQARVVAQIAHDRALRVRAVPESASWRELGALGSDVAGHLYVLDSGARRLLEYTGLAQRTVTPPRVLLDGTSTPGLSLERVAEIVGQDDQVFLRLDDGTVHRLSADGSDHQLMVRPPGGRLSVISAMASDRAGGLYLADPAGARILQVTGDGEFVRQFRDPALGGLRQIQSSKDGQHIYGLVASGVLVFDVPAL